MSTLPFLDIQTYNNTEDTFENDGIISPDELVRFVHNLLSTTPICGTHNRKYAGKQINWDAFKSIFKRIHIYSYARVIQCIIDNLEFILSEFPVRESILSIVNPDLIFGRNFVIEKVLSAGSNGQAILVHFSEDPSAKMVCKVPLLSTPIDIIQSSFMLEYFKGISIINNFRTFCPTFCYTLGAIMCDSSALGKHVPMNGGISGHNIPLILYEYINGDALTDRNTTLETFVTCLIQIGISLELAQREARFCHFDLTTSNVMIERETKKFEIKIDDHVFEFNSRKAVIIDFGLSTGLYNKRLIYPVNTFPQFSKFRFLVPGFDMMFFISVCAAYCANKKIVEYIRKIIPLICREDPYKIATQPQKALVKQYTTDYFAKYGFGSSAVLTPGDFVTLLLSDEETKNLIKDTINIRTRTSTYVESPSVYYLYNKLYDNKAYTTMDFSNVLSGINSYIQAQEIIKIAETNPGLFNKDQLAEFTAKIQLTLEEMKDEDADMLYGYEALKNLPSFSDSSRAITLGQHNTDYGYLTKYITDTNSYALLDAYVKIYYLIYRVGLETEEPYSSFVSRFPIHRYKTFFPHIIRARRWAFTMFEMHNRFVGIHNR